MLISCRSLPSLRAGLAVWPGAYPLTDGRRRREAGARERADRRAAPRAARLARRLPLLRRATASCSTSARRARSASGSPRTSPAARPGSTSRVDRIDVPGHRQRGRGAARRAELHQAPPAALQHPPARRQVLPLRRASASTRTTRASTSPARSTAPAAPTSAPSPAPSGCARRSTCSASSSSSAPARGPSRAGAPAAPASTTTSSAAGRPASATSASEEYRRNIDAIVDFLSGRYRQVEADEQAKMEEAAGGAGIRARGDPPRPAGGDPLAVRAPAGRRRLGRHRRPDRRRGRGRRRQRPGLPGPRRHPRRAPELLPRQPGRARAGRGRRGVHRPVLLGLAVDPADDRRRPLRCASAPSCSPRR